MKVRHTGVVVAATMATPLVAACGTGSSGTSAASRPAAGASTASSTPTAVGSPPASATLVQQVEAAVANARSVHLVATVTQQGSTYHLNLGMTRSNEMSGDMSYNNETLTLLVRNGRAYIKFTAAAVKAMNLPSTACVLMCGKWMKMTASDSKSMVGDFSWSSFVGQSNTLPRLSYVRTVMVNGQPAWQVNARGEGTVYVAARGTPYPLRLVQGVNRIDFTQWNSVVIPPLPPANQTVDISQLENM